MGPLEKAAVGAKGKKAAYPVGGAARALKDTVNAKPVPNPRPGGDAPASITGKRG